MELRFNHLEALHWLWAVPVIAVLLIVGIELRRRALRRFATPSLHRHLVNDAGFRRRWVRAGLITAAALFLVAALIDPRLGVSYRQVPQRGVDIMIVLDVSRSMLAQDARPDRLERARQFIGDLLDQLAGDRIGLVAFAGNAWLKCPLTIDYRAVRIAAEEVTPATAPRGGSLLGDALRVAAGSFTDEVPDHKVIIVFSDGEDHGSFPVEAAASIAQEHSIPVYTVGIGDGQTGARVPARPGSGRWLMHEGQQVWSKLDGALLRQVALASGGAYVPVGTGIVDMARVYQERIEPVAKRDREAVTIKQYHPRYQWLVAAALLLLAAESWLAVRGPKRTTLRRSPLGRISAATAALVAALALLGADEPVSPSKLALDAAEAMEQERYDDALGIYEKLRTSHPDLAEIPFNMGVAAYRAGELDRAAEYFNQARTLAADPALQARSAYNQGTTAYRRAANGAQAVTEGLAGIDDATRDLTDALDRYRQAIDADPDDRDARANGELTWKLLKQLEELKEQLEQQQPEQQGDQQEQEGNENPDEDQQNQQQQSQGLEGEEPPDQQAQGQQDSNEDAESGDEREREGAAPSDEPPMSREQAERLLQRVRDRDRERREELARAEEARQPPVAKDW